MLGAPDGMPGAPWLQGDQRAHVADEVPPSPGMATPLIGSQLANLDFSGYNLGKEMKTWLNRWDITNNWVNYFLRVGAILASLFGMKV